MKNIILTIICVLSIISFTCNAQSEPINGKFTCKRSVKIIVKISDGKIISNQEYLYKTLEIYLVKVDLDIGVGRVQIFDNDRAINLEFSLLYNIKEKSGFFKLPYHNNDEFGVSAFGSDGGKSRSDLFLCLNQKDFVLMIETVATYDGEKYLYKEIYYDLKTL